ncbi:hypothetical protein [Peribacillus sp. SI8-4]|uniref:hypothetical protein n=1 Tax=Peribacillus sp. SI8-4 TaxID=3048009 RepID=UPI0025571B4D|nr:hypothetical protein [Peribacillus sp. SI8-4]
MSLLLSIEPKGYRGLEINGKQPRALTGMHGFSFIIMIPFTFRKKAIGLYAPQGSLKSAYTNRGREL